MLTKLNDSAIPFEIKQASLYIITYATVVFISALWFAITNNFGDTIDFMRAIVRFLGMSYIGWWLMSGDKIAWWFGMVASSIFLSFGIIAIGIFLVVGVAYDSGLLWIVLNLLFPVYLLGHAVWILSRKSTREYFA